MLCILDKNLMFICVCVNIYVSVCIQDGSPLTLQSVQGAMAAMADSVQATFDAAKAVKSLT